MTQETKNEEGKIVLRDATMKKTAGVDPSLDLSKPQNVAKVAMMDNDTHPDLLGAIYNELVGRGLPAERADIYLNHFMVVAARGKSLMAQRQALVSYWNYQMLLLGEPAYPARQTLAHMNAMASVGDIITLFTNLPLDVILKFDLPKETVMPVLEEPAPEKGPEQVI